jgi:tetratricopeptide (TPR) repeat protein
MQEEQAEGNKRALVIAVSEYDSPNLKPIKFCENDGHEMYKVLTKVGYEIPDDCKWIGNIKSQTLKEAIYNFFTNEENKPDDTLVFYYSGHGVPDKFGATFLAPSDIHSDHPFMTGFSFLDLTNSMLACNSLRVVTILDCCYSGSLELSKGLDSKSGEEAAIRIANKIVDEKGDKLKQGVGRCLLASSQGYEEAYDRMEKDHSIFTYYLLEALNGHKNAVDDEGNVTYDSVGRFISREIGSLPPERRPNQTPIRKGEVSGGDIVLAHYTKQPAVDTKYTTADRKYTYSRSILEALEYMEAEDYTNALSCLDRAIKIDPKNAKAYFYQGNTFVKLAKYQEATKSYQRALEIDPNPKYASAVSRLLGLVATYIEKKKKGDEPEAKDVQKKIQKNVDSATMTATKKAENELANVSRLVKERQMMGRALDKVERCVTCNGPVMENSGRCTGCGMYPSLCFCGKKSVSEKWVDGQWVSEAFQEKIDRRERVENAHDTAQSSDSIFTLLRQGRLTEFNQRRPKIGYLDLYGANLYNASLMGIDLTGANLIESDLGDADLSGADLSGADLTNSQCGGVNLTNSRLVHTNLTGANLMSAKLKGADLTDAILTGAILYYLRPEDLPITKQEARARGAYVD